MTAGEKAIEAARQVYLEEVRQARTDAEVDAAVRKYGAVCRENRGR